MAWKTLFHNFCKIFCCLGWCNKLVALLCGIFSEDTLESDRKSYTNWKWFLKIDDWHHFSSFFTLWNPHPPLISQACNKSVNYNIFNMKNAQNFCGAGFVYKGNVCHNNWRVGEHVRRKTKGAVHYNKQKQGTELTISCRMWRSRVKEWCMRRASSFRQDAFIVWLETTGTGWPVCISG